ncbi:unnamed protein product [Lathyrus sativus]|nr:unnamed protein product [Lathyrus sativus]
MKLLYSLTLSFLLFVFITNLSTAFSNDDNEEIHDITGAPVIAGKKYYISASIGGRATGGGLELGRTSLSKCDVTILQTNKTNVFGTSVEFTIIGNNSEKILTDTPLYIQVTKEPNCVATSDWILFYDYDINKRCVGIGGFRNYYAPVYYGSFKILKHGFGYKFGFCPLGSIAYSDIGSYQNSGEGGKRLYLLRGEVNDTFEFVIVPAFLESGIIKSVA